MADACMAVYECGGYLYSLWSRDGGLASLPPSWAGAIGRAHSKTVIDNLAALSQLRSIGRLLIEERVRFILMKGAAYLLDLYSDPGARHLTDIDLLIRRSDAGRLARRLVREGYRGEVGVHFPENRRFEMWIPIEAHCRFEFHWSLGLPLRAAVEQEAVWERSLPGVLEDLPCRRLASEDALLFHAVHDADTYFGPSLKWAIDLREMFRRWHPDLSVLRSRGASWRCRTALHLALSHLEKIFPGEAPRSLLEDTAPGLLRRRLLGFYRSSEPASLISVHGNTRRRYPLRFLMLDRAADAALLTLQVLSRPLTRRLARLRGCSTPPWEWSD